MKIYNVIRFDKIQHNEPHRCGFGCDIYADYCNKKYDISHVEFKITVEKSFLELSTAKAFIKGTNKQIYESELVPKGAIVIP